MRKTLIALVLCFFASLAIGQATTQPDNRTNVEGSDDDIKTFFVELQTLNSDYGSEARGTATFTLNTRDPNMPSLRVEVNASDLEDLTSIPGAVHVAHIHGQFEGNRGRPLTAQGDGPFFEGTGGVLVNSVLPTDDDLNVDETDLGFEENFLDFFEGLPSYGPVVLNLARAQLPSPPEGVPPLVHFFQLAAEGRINPADLFPSGTTFQLDQTYTFNLSDPDQLRQYNNIAGANGDQLDKREIVLHGLTIPTPISDAIDQATNAAPESPTAGVPLGNGQSFRSTAPVLAGEIRMQETGTQQQTFQQQDNQQAQDNQQDQDTQ